MHPYSGGTDLVVLKLEKQGKFQWHTFYGFGEDDDGFGIAVGADNSLYLTGRSTLSWLGDEGAQPRHPLSGGTDLVALKLDGSGGYQWHAFYGSNDYDSGAAIAIAGERGVYLAGWSYKTWLGEGGLAPLHSHSGGPDLVLLKLTAKDLYYLPVVYIYKQP